MNTKSKMAIKEIALRSWISKAREYAESTYRSRLGTNGLLLKAILFAVVGIYYLLFDIRTIIAGKGEDFANEE